MNGKSEGISTKRQSSIPLLISAAHSAALKGRKRVIIRRNRKTEKPKSFFIKNTSFNFMPAPKA